ncbi:MAG: ligand-binding sensor domain-containing protein [Aureispira sp.]
MPLIYCLLFSSLVGMLMNFHACAPKKQPSTERPIPVTTINKYFLDPKTDTVLRLKFTTNIRAIFEDRKGNFWFGSDQEGLCLFDGKSLTYFKEKGKATDNQIRAIFEDKTGRIWLEKAKGTSYYDGKQLKAYSNRNYSSKQKWQLQEDDLWFKSDERVGYNPLEETAGVYRYDGQQFYYHTFPLLPKTEDNFQYSSSTPFVRGQNGRLWMGTYNAVIGYDGRDFTILDNKRLGLTKETGQLHIRSLFEDSKGILWIGNNGIGLWCFDGKKTFPFAQQYDLGFPNSLSSYQTPTKGPNHVFAIQEDNKGILWFGDRDTGAWSYDGTSLKNYNLKDGLTTTQILKIYKDRRGTLWFGLANGQVFQFNGTSFYRVL